MFDRLYQKDIDMMRAIINQKQVIQNTYHRMSHDENLKRYLKLAVHYAKSGGSRDVMGFNDHYFITRHNDDIMTVFRLFVATLLEIHIDKSGQDIARPRSMFPDHGGETLIRLMGFMPLLELVSEHVKFVAFIKSQTAIEGDRSIVDSQRKRLFSHSNIMSKAKFPRDDKFTDYALKNEYIETLKVEFSAREGELLHNMDVIASALEPNPTLSNDHALSMGLNFWDLKRSNKQQGDKKTLEMFATLIQGLVQNHPDDDAQDKVKTS
jgi:hypothetical protein